MPEEPEALMEHDALHLLARDGAPAPWLLRRGEASWQGTPPARATVNAPNLLTRFALGGLGIAMLGDAVVDADVRSGALVPVLPDWQPPSVTVSAVFPGRRLMPARTRVFIDALQAEFSGVRCGAVHKQVEETKARRHRGAAR
jgi:DNA-binding transcriptional LysR family regulator